MSKQAETITVCPCGEENTVQFTKPTYFGPTITKYNCGKCESRIQVKFSKVKNNSEQVDNKIGIIEASESLNVILAERKRAWLKEQSDAAKSGATQGGKTKPVPVST